MVPDITIFHNGRPKFGFEIQSGYDNIYFTTRKEKFNKSTLESLYIVYLNNSGQHIFSGIRKGNNTAITNPEIIEMESTPFAKMIQDDADFATTVLARTNSKIDAVTTEMGNFKTDVNAKLDKIMNALNIKK